MTKPKKGTMRATAKKIVKPIAPTKAEAAPDAPEVQDFTWAARNVQAGFKVKRESWTGNKTMSKDDRSGKAILSTDDMASIDCVIA